MNTIRHKAYILQTLNYSLTDSLMAVAIIHSLSKTYSILKTILLSTPEDKLSSDMILDMVCTWGWKFVELAQTCTECRNSCNELGDVDLSE